MSNDTIEVMFSKEYIHLLDAEIERAAKHILALTLPVEDYAYFRGMHYALINARDVYKEKLKKYFNN
jgi:hypothetical protein